MSGPKPRPFEQATHQQPRQTPPNHTTSDSATKPRTRNQGQRQTPAKTRPVWERDATCLESRGQRQQHPDMNKQDQQDVNANSDTGGGQPDTDKRRDMITAAMENEGLGPEQLPALWQQLTEETGATELLNVWDRHTGATELLNAWDRHIDAMYRRCDTWPQYAEILVVLAELPLSAWYYTTQIADHGDDLIRQASTEQLQQSLMFEQQHSREWREVSKRILSWASTEQLVGPVITQLAWDNETASAGPIPEYVAVAEDDYYYRRRYIVEHIQQEMLDGNDSYWSVFLGIVEPKNRIGDIVELALAIEQQRRPNKPDKT